jgi:alpha-N-arabinofuranosidase
MINRSVDDPVMVAVDARATAASRIETALTIAGPDPDAVNTSTQPNNVVPRELAGIEIDDGQVTLVVPPASWTLLSLRN